MWARQNTITAIALTTLLVLAGCSSSGSGVDATETTGAATSSESSTDVDTTTVESQDSEADNTDTESTDTDNADSSDLVVSAVAAAESLINVLSDDELDTLSYDYGDQTITTSWSNLPACDVNGRAGIRHGDLSDEQLDAVLSVAAVVLSDEGYEEYRQIIAADESLGGGDGDVWDADCYYLAFFGSPSTTDAWAMQFGGHHYARTIAFTDGDTTITPAFTGVEPKSFTLDGATIEPLADEADAIFGIFENLDDSQLTSAELSGAFDDILLGPGDDDAFPTSEGVALADLSDDASAAALSAIRTWVDDFDAEVADAVIADVESELDATYIGWSSSTDVDSEGSYARIDGPSVWIEFINQSGVGTGDIHHHSVYRDKADDYGTAA